MGRYMRNPRKNAKTDIDALRRQVLAIMFCEIKVELGVRVFLIRFLEMKTPQKG